MNLHTGLTSSAAWLLVALGVLPLASTAAADRIILRSLKIIADRQVVSFDEDGVRLEDQSQLPWYDIEKGTVAADKQAAFDRQLMELGGPLYRIRQRLATRDYHGALQPAEQLAARFAQSTSDSAYLVQQALMWGRIAGGRRESALGPYLRCFELLRARPGSAKILTGDRRMQFDLMTGLTPELAPIWFDRAAAGQELPAVYRRIAEIAKPRPAGAYIYYVTLALAAGDEAAATRVLNVIPSDQGPLGELRLIIEAQREITARRAGPAVAELAAAVERMSTEHRPLAWYWLGVGQLAGPDADRRDAGRLDLLRIPALVGREQPELAGAALFQVMRSLGEQGDASGSVAVRRELLERYGQSYHAIQVRGATELEKKP